MWKTARADLPAGLVVFLISLPLCLGVAQAAGAPMLSGVIAGIVGGVVVGLLSGAPLSVSGPAAGLSVVMVHAITTLSLPAFFTAVVLAGAMQAAMGALRLGAVSNLFPSAAVKGMLAAVGVLLILKQLPHAVGYDKDYEGDEDFFQVDGETTFGGLLHAANDMHGGIIAVTLISVACYIGWTALRKKVKLLAAIPPHLVVVVAGAVVALLLEENGRWDLDAPHMVLLPSLSALRTSWNAPALSALADLAVWKTAVAVALVASIESLLSVEALDRLDPRHRISPPNRELVAQGVGNMVSGLLGGLPLTSALVRSSAGVAAGAQGRLSTIVHGVLLALGVAFGARVLNHVPLASLAVILIFIGYRLTSVSVWRDMWTQGAAQFVPFALTVVAVVFTDLLTGALIGVFAGVFFALAGQARNSFVLSHEGNDYLFRSTKDLAFFAKSAVKKALQSIPSGATVRIDLLRSDYVDSDIAELLRNFQGAASERGMDLSVQDRVGRKIIEEKT
jgi:MFS superfamily sulfate permease-like transporter